MVTDSCPILLITWDSRMKENLSRLIIYWHCLKSPALTQRHTGLRNTHTRCGLWATNNSLNQKHFRKQDELLVSKHMFIFPINHLSYILTNRLMQETGNNRTRHSPDWNKLVKVQSGPRYSNVALKPRKLGKARLSYSRKSRGVKEGIFLVYFSHSTASQIKRTLPKPRNSPETKQRLTWFEFLFITWSLLYSVCSFSWTCLQM